MRHAIGVAVLGFALLSAESAAAKPRRRGDWVVGRVAAVTRNAIYFDFGARFGLRPADAVQLRIARRWSLERKFDEVGPSFSRSLRSPGERIPAVGTPARSRFRSIAATSGRKRPKALQPPLDRKTVNRLWSGVALERPERIEYRPGPQHRGKKDPRKAVSRTLAFGSLGLGYAGTLNLDSAARAASYQQLSLFSTLDVRGLLARRLSYSHRISVRLPLARDLDARPFPNSRPKLAVRRLALGVALPGIRFALGRLVGAPTPDAGLVDGATARVRLTRGLYLGAFGGLTPGIDDLLPHVDASNFGVYTSLRMGGAGAHRWTLAADLGALGSTYDGSLDRKALSGQLLFHHPRFMVDACWVLDLYAADHPSGLSGVDPSWLSARLRATPARWITLGVAYERYRLVPTREVLALGLGLEASVDTFQANLDLRPAQWLLLLVDGGLSCASEASCNAWGQLSSAFGPLFGNTDRLRLSALASRGNIFDSIGASLGYSFELVSGLDLGLSYGLYSDSYREQDHTSYRHSAGATADLMLGRRLSINLDSLLQLSDEEQLLQIVAGMLLSF